MKRLALISIFFLIFSLAAASQARNQQLPGAPRSGPVRLTGIATNGTTNKPAAGDDVVLLKPGQSMEEVGRAKVDSKGQFTLTIPEDGMPIHAIRINHQKADFVRPVRAGETNVTITVYDTAPAVEGVRVTDQSEVFQSEGTTLMGVELFTIENNSTPPKAQPTFQFYLPDGAVLKDGQAFSNDLMPVKRTPIPLDEKNKYEIRYPLRPGMTRFEVTYTIPYTGSIKLNSKIATSAEKFYVVVPKSMTFNGSGSGFHPEDWPIEPGLPLDTNAIEKPEAGKQLAYEISGSGKFPDSPPQTASNSSGGRGGAPQEDNRPGGGMGIPNSNPIPLGDSSKWYFLGLLTLFLAGGGAMVFFGNRQSVVPVAPTPVGRGGTQDRSAALLEALKEEIFQLESERVKNKISQQDYDKAKAALDNTLQRAMRRSG